jgi:hypothetical protein
MVQLVRHRTHLVAATMASAVLIIGCGGLNLPGTAGDEGPRCEPVGTGAIELVSSYYPTAEFDGRTYYWHGFQIAFATADEVTPLGRAACIPFDGISSPDVFALEGVDQAAVIVLPADPASDTVGSPPPGTRPYGLFLRLDLSEGPLEMCRFFRAGEGPSECGPAVQTS